MVLKFSVPNAQRYEDYTEAPLLYSAILANDGGGKAFEAALAKAAGMLLIFLGSGIAVLRLTRLNVMQLLRKEK